MPRSVVHEVEGGELRVWRTSADDWLHVKLAATRQVGGKSYEVDARWDIPTEAGRWTDIATRARDGDADAARSLSDSMFTEALAEA